MAVWFVTGASSGIGRAVVERLLARGDRVAATSRCAEKLTELVRKHPATLWTAALDVTDAVAVREVVNRAFTELGRIDVLFSNAGHKAFGAAEEFSDEMIADQIALHLTGPIHLVRAALPHLRKQGGGRIIQTTGLEAEVGLPGGSVHHASKWGAEGFFESLAAEVAPFGVEVMMVVPGNVRTDYGAATSIAFPAPEYAETPIGRIRRYLDSHGGRLVASVQSDPAQVAAAILDAASAVPAPRRVVLGSDAYLAVHAALAARMAELEAGWTVSVSTDLPV
ncbi:SDR family oxidoreductase [Micromonospora sp. NPDC048898]|uniref:SDR family oxidoreductase n=1 Tax=Micromonospora sp. NPDC048898 TaxID=3364260 RepID=UPI003717369D